MGCAASQFRTVRTSTAVVAVAADDWGTANAGEPCPQIPQDDNNLALLAGATGGHDYQASNSQGGVDAIASEVARALKTQYLIGYKSTNNAKDGKRRGLKVKVNPPEGSPKLKVWTKSGYYVITYASGAAK